MLQETIPSREEKVANVTSEVGCRDCVDDLSSPLDFGMGAPPHSPTLSDRSLIFERDVQDDPFLLAPSSSTTLTSLNINSLSKQRSNSSASLYRQRTSESATSSSSYLMNQNSNNSNNNAMIPPPVSIIPNRSRLSRANSSSNGINPLASPLSTSMSSSSGFFSPISNNSYNATNMTSNGNNGLHHHRRRTLENYVAPALDASCSLVNENSTNLSDINIIHSRSSSTIGLDMALGRVSTNSRSNTRNNSTVDLSNDERAESNNSNVNSTSNETDSKVLKFYSYNDLLNDEKLKDINVASYAYKKPSLTSSYSTSYFKSPTSPLQSGDTSPIAGNSNLHFLNPFVIGRGSSPFLSPQQTSRRYSNNTGNNPLSKSPTNSSALGIQDTLTNNINNTSSVLLQDPLSTGNVTPTNIKNHLRKSISKGMSQQSQKRPSQENTLAKTVSKFHIASSESESEHDDDDDEVAITNDEDEGNEEIISSMPLRIKNLRSYSSSSQNRNSPLMVKTTKFLGSRSRTNSVIQLQQHYENVVTEPITSTDSPVALDQYQLQTEKIDDVIKDRVSSTK